MPCTLEACWSVARGLQEIGAGLLEIDGADLSFAQQPDVLPLSPVLSSGLQHIPPPCLGCESEASGVFVGISW